MFHQASVKLAALYLGIIMLISLFFSINIYQLSIGEFDRGFHPPSATQEGGPNFNMLPPRLKAQFIQQQDYIYQEAKDRVFSRLVATNIFILIGGGALSYYLARRTLKPIEEAHAAQSRFTADASHELRTPIAAMQSEIEVTLMDPKLSLGKAKKVLVSNLEELVKLTALTEGLLKMAQLENGELPTTEFAVSEATQAAISRVLPAAEVKHIHVLSDDSTDAKIKGDQAGLTEAIVVILDNAIKYSPQKSEVNLKVERTKSSVLIHVADKGMGIKPEDLDHIFERFYRADSARTKSETEGYGVGLAIAKNIVELHDGQISVESKPKKGSTFTIELPLKDSNSS